MKSLSFNDLKMIRYIKEYTGLAAASPFLCFETGRCQSSTFEFFSQSSNSSGVMTSRSHFFFISLACSLQA